MKRQDIAKLHHETLEELTAKITTLQKDLVEVRMQVQMGKEKNLKRIKNIKTDIARIKTIISTKSKS